VPLGGGFNFSLPTGVALDGSGNVFVTDSGANAVYEILVASSYTTVITLSTSMRSRPVLRN
jgi:hypothetical protein